MDTASLKSAIRAELPLLLREDPSLREYVMNTTRLVYADKQDTEDRILKILDEMRLDREEQGRKWEEQNRKWDENQKAINEMIAELKRQDTKVDSRIGALGARWGIFSEESFRNGLKAILEESFGARVLNVTEYDDDGEVFGRPDQVELDVIMYNGMLILCETKFSMSKADIHFFDRKTAYYEKHHNREVTRKMVISPMVDKRAKDLAKRLGIEVYSHSYDVSLEQNDEHCPK